MQSPDEPVRPLVVSKPEAAAMLGVSERTIFNLAKRGEIVSCKLGSAVRYTVESIQRLAGVRGAQAEGSR